MLCTLSIVCHTGYMMRVQYIAQASAVSEPAVSTNTKKKQAPHVVENGPMMDAASTETKTICCTVQVPASAMGSRIIHPCGVGHSLNAGCGAGFVSLPSVLTIHFLLQQRAEVNGLKPKLMQGCVHVHEAEDEETTQHADIVVTGQTPSICSGSMGSLCAHFSVHCTPTGSSCSVRCLCVKKVRKKQETLT